MKSSTIIVELCIPHLNPVNVDFIYLGALMFDT